MFHWGLMTTYLNHALAIAHLPSTITSFRPFNGHWSAQVWFFSLHLLYLNLVFKKKKDRRRRGKEKKSGIACNESLDGLLSQSHGGSEPYCMFAIALSHSLSCE
jgi:hypothetical protein